jgi:hypothetical protein
MDQIHLSPLVDQIQLALKHISNSYRIRIIAGANNLTSHMACLCVEAAGPQAQSIMTGCVGQSLPLAHDPMPCQPWLVWFACGGMDDAPAWHRACQHVRVSMPLRRRRGPPAGATARTPATRVLSDCAGYYGALEKELSRGRARRAPPTAAASWPPCPTSTRVWRTGPASPVTTSGLNSVVTNVKPRRFACWLLPAWALTYMSRFTIFFLLSCDSQNHRCPKICNPIHNWLIYRIDVLWIITNCYMIFGSTEFKLLPSIIKVWISF